MKEFNDSVGGCPDENTLQAYTRGALSQKGRAQVETHIDGCSSCRLVLSAIAKAVPMTEPGRGLSIEAETDPDVGANSGNPMPGSVLSDRFRLKGIIGRGAMGIVYEAIDEKLNERIALKLLAPHISRKADVLEWLRREILLSRKISHPNVCRVFDLGISKNLHFITLQLVEGQNLDQLLAAGPIAPETAAGVLEQLASALAGAHREGVVHRDLKASNLMLDGAGHLWVMDFGLARDLEKDPSYSGPVGTPAYWSPEQATGEPATPASDVYSFGVVAYRLFTSELPRPHKEPLRLGGVPRRFRSIIAKCLEQRMGDRFTDGAAVHAAWVRAMTQSERGRARVLLSVVVLAAFVLGGVLMLARRPAETPLMPAPVAQPAPVVAPPPLPAPVPVEAIVVPAPAAVVPDAGTPKRATGKKPRTDIPIFE